MNKLRSVALYLPQFHRLRENDLWWGEGFTEWTAVKAAKKLFTGHRQPKVPMDNHYYNLLDKKTMQWQADLAHRYKVDGFCFYHYWFKDGRKILEKPAEQLLQWKDVDIQYCFSWANETWARSWDVVPNKNVWTDKFEPSSLSKDAGILLEQKYGDELQWKEHFYYLLKFFSDKRYMKHAGKPVFVIYRPEIIPCLIRMLKYWRSLAIENGLPGLYIISMNTKNNLSGFDAVINNMSKSETGTSVEIKDTTVHGIDYDLCWENYLHASAVEGVKNIWCGIVNYDDTPRRGMNGLVYLGGTPQKFHNYYKRLVQRSIESDSPFIFINAWNEWGEGMYLEPDCEAGYAYLSAIKAVMQEYEGGNLRIQSSQRVHSAYEKDQECRIQELENKADKFEQYYNLLNMWMILKEKGVSLEQYFMKHGYKKIAIYGYGNIGKHLRYDLRESQVEVMCAIDKKSKSCQADIPVYDLNDSFPTCDVIVITVINEYEKIIVDLDKVVNCPIVSLSEVVSECV